MCHKDKTFEHYILKLTIDIPFENTIIIFINTLNQTSNDK